MDTMRKILDVLREDVANDVSMRSRVSPAYHRFASYAATLPEGDFEIEIGSLGNFIGYDAGKIGFEDDLSHYAIILGVRQPGAHGMSGAIIDLGETILGSITRAIAIYCLEKDGDDPISMINSTRFMGVFQHEYMHVLDDLRTDGKITARDRSDPKNDKLGYVNDPAEFNAYFHDIAAPLTDILAHKDTPDFADHANLYGFDPDFKNTITSLLNSHSKKSYFKLLYPDRRKAFVSRLWRLHREIVTALASQPPIPA